MATFVTCNRKLEQTLFMLGIHHLEWRKTEDGMTEWVYANTPKLRQIVEWFREANATRAKGGW